MTFSLLAHDDDHLGVVTASHWVAVGSMVPWARAGVGAVATQAFTAPGYGPAALAGLAGGADPGLLLERLLAADPESASRQVAVIDAAGRTARHTGSGCFAITAEAEGPAAVAVGNMLGGRRVPQAMIDGWSGATGSLAERLLAGLSAGQGAGGDARGRQAAALLVVERFGDHEPGDGVVVDVRVDDHPAPVDELARLARIAENSRLIADIAFPATPAGDPDRAAAWQQAAHRLSDLRADDAGWEGAGGEAAIWLAYLLLLQGDDSGARDALRDNLDLLPTVREWARQPR